MAGQSFPVGEQKLRVQREGHWLVIWLPVEKRAVITEDAHLEGILAEYFERGGIDPGEVPNLAAEIRASAATLPERRSMNSDGRPATEAAAIDWMVERVPELSPILDAHLDYHDELLSYVVFESDFTGWFINAVKIGNSRMARRFCDGVETLMTTDTHPPADDPVWNLAGVAFTEALVLGGEHEVIERARDWFGPATMKDIEYMQRGTTPHRA